MSPGTNMVMHEHTDSRTGSAEPFVCRDGQCLTSHARVPGSAVQGQGAGTNGAALVECISLVVGELGYSEPKGISRPVYVLDNGPAKSFRVLVT